MKPSLVDTDTLSFFFKRHPSVVSSFEVYSQQYSRVNLSIITYYEILSGLKHRNANKKLEIFLDFAAQNTVLPLTEEAATIASEHYATLRKQGQPLEDIDLLIAGIALSNKGNKGVRSSFLTEMKNEDPSVSHILDRNEE